MRKFLILLVFILIIFATQTVENASSQSSPCVSQCEKENATCIFKCQTLGAGWSALDACMQQCSIKWAACDQLCQEDGEKGHQTSKQCENHLPQVQMPLPAVTMKKISVLLVILLLGSATQTPEDSSSQTTSCESRCRSSYSDCVSDCQKLPAGWSAIDFCVNQCTEKWNQCKRLCLEEEKLPTKQSDGNAVNF